MADDDIIECTAKHLDRNVVETRVHALLERLMAELVAARDEAAVWKDRWRAERADHEAAMKHADKAINDAVNGY